MVCRRMTILESSFKQYLGCSIDVTLIFEPVANVCNKLIMLFQKLDPLVSLARKRAPLSDLELSECKKLIQTLGTMEKSGNPLTTIVSCAKLKGTKRYFPVYCFSRIDASKLE